MKDLTPQKIIDITKKQGYFDVSLKWRYASLQEMVSKLVDEKILKKEKRIGSLIRFTLKEKQNV